MRDIIGPDDVENMPVAQRELALRSIQIARQGLDITVNSPAYRQGMMYGMTDFFLLSCFWYYISHVFSSTAVHYTHATATFAASFLLRLARLLYARFSFLFFLRGINV